MLGDLRQESGPSTDTRILGANFQKTQKNKLSQKVYFKAFCKNINNY